ncbi:transcription antitermination factor NusB [Corynebacterium bouchesdurhonense]|uniref:transcription antitermination factor NusB n=1 Tax=Corynebacterium bouchesdurhonense TaxID=1720192 RepID=UPI00082C7ECD|nr:transcription antitermination factor NusB [Corynebacterium bouchesdurhonense]
MPDYKRHGARYRARRRAVDILFEAETRDIDPVAIVEDRAELARDPQNAVAPIADYTREIIQGVAETLDDLDDNIERFLDRDWELHRLPAVDRQILRLATWEILFNDEVPPAIAIANALEMATEYSGNQAPPYIHAMLDGITQAQSPDAPGDAAGEGASTSDMPHGDA